VKPVTLNVTQLIDCPELHVLAVGAAQGKAQCVSPFGRCGGNVDAFDA
jgi:hypothetical protein